MIRGPRSRAVGHRDRVHDPYRLPITDSGLVQEDVLDAPMIWTSTEIPLSPAAAAVKRRDDRADSLAPAGASALLVRFAGGRPAPAGRAPSPATALAKGGPVLSSVLWL